MQKLKHHFIKSPFAFLSLAAAVALIATSIYCSYNYFRLKSITVDFLLNPKNGYFQYYPIVITLLLFSAGFILLINLALLYTQKRRDRNK